MYEDRKSSFSIKSVLLQLLTIIIFILAMIWLFPTKSYLNDNQVNEGNLKDNLTPLYNRVFADNIESMRDAARDYFTTERLPQKVGDSVKITLKEMIEKKLVLAFTDSNNKACDVEESYVELVKMDNEYQMKVQLSCSDKSDYIIAYMGCYDYCENDICEAQDPKPAPKPVPTPSKSYMYEYGLNIQDTYSDWSDWSDWSTDYIEEGILKQVQSETRDVLKGYEQVWSIVGYDKKEEITYKEQISQVQVGTKKESAGTKTLTKDAVYTEDTYSDWSYKGYVVVRYALSTYVSPTSTVKYVYVSDKTVIDCSNMCKNVTEYTYKKYTRTVSTGGYSCDSYGPDWTLEGNKCTKLETIYKDVAVYEDVVEQVPIVKLKEIPVYGYVEGDPIYETVTYYRYRTRNQLTVESTDYKWSKSKQDKELLENGYVLTGNVKEV